MPTRLPGSPWPSVPSPYATCKQVSPSRLPLGDCAERARPRLLPGYSWVIRAAERVDVQNGCGCPSMAGLPWRSSAMHASCSAFVMIVSLFEQLGIEVKRQHEWLLIRHPRGEERQAKKS